MNQPNSNEWRAPDGSIILKPCPGCAGPARFVSFRHQVKEGNIKCDRDECGVMSVWGTAEEAAKKWNEASGFWVSERVCPKCRGTETEHEGSEIEGKGYRKKCRKCGHKGPTGSCVSGAARLWHLEAKRLLDSGKTGSPSYT